MIDWDPFPIIVLPSDEELTDPDYVPEGGNALCKACAKKEYGKGRRLLFSELMKTRELVARAKPVEIDFEVISDKEIEQIQRYWQQVDNLVPWSRQEDQMQFSF